MVIPPYSIVCFLFGITIFFAKVWLVDRFLGKGMGRSKKAAEQAAAKQAFLSVSKQ